MRNFLNLVYILRSSLETTGRSKNTRILKNLNLFAAGTVLTQIQYRQFQSIWIA